VGEGEVITLTAFWWRSFSWVSEPEPSSVLLERNFPDMITVTAECRLKHSENAQTLYSKLLWFLFAYSSTLPILQKAVCPTATC